MSTTCLLLHGAGSCPGTVRDLLGPACPVGAAVLVPRLDGGVEDAVATVEHLVAEAAREGHPVGLVGGISLGAHAAALWAARTGTTVPLVLAMPAWTGPPDDVAALTVASAAEIRRLGRDPVLERLRAEHPHDWVVAELARGWLLREEAVLVAALEAAGRSPAPGADDLARIRGRTAVVGLDGDPLHPAAVARAWADAVPHAQVALVERDAPASDRGILGRTARALLAGPVSGSR